MTLPREVGVGALARAAPRRRAPGPKPRPWADLLRYVRDPIGFLTALAREYGNIACVKLGPYEYFLLNDPEYIRDVLVTHHRSFMKGRAYQEAKRLLGEGLLTSEGDFHHRQRRLVQPIFSQERIAGYGALMTEYGARTRERWQEGTALDVNEEMMRLTLAVVGKALFDADVESEAREVGEGLEAGMAVFNRFLFPFSRLLWSLPVPGTRRFERARGRLDTLIYRMIGERRASAAEGDDLLSLLLRAQDEEGDGGGMTDLQVRDEAMTILLAGHETTAQALTWTWYVLSQHPEVEAGLHRELDAVLGDRLPLVDDLPRLAYTRMVLAEVLRLYPPAWLITRRALVDHELDGYVLPAGSIVLISQFVTHRDPRHFPEPSRFAPERWTPEAEAGRARYVYFPFGGGPRLCIGERFAWMEGLLLLATLAQRWRMRLVPGERVELRPIVTLRPKHGLRMTLERRERRH